MPQAGVRFVAWNLEELSKGFLWVSLVEFLVLSFEVFLEYLKDVRVFIQVCIYRPGFVINTLWHF
jgi:hypothetical protein